jgi:hypothetical protein
MDETRAPALRRSAAATAARARRARMHALH